MSNLVGDVVQLDGELNEHLVDIEQVVAEDAKIRAEIVRVLAPGQHRKQSGAKDVELIF